MKFNLHEQLQKDTFWVEDWTLCRVLLMNNSTFPWLILVPLRENLCEIYDLDKMDQTMLMQEISMAASILQKIYTPDKINIGALGNLVPQLHIHVIARVHHDPLWPKPVWGNTQAAPYSDTAREQTLLKLREHYSQDIIA